jgi:hypothetical protein
MKARAPVKRVAVGDGGADERKPINVDPAVHERLVVRKRAEMLGHASGGPHVLGKIHNLAQSLFSKHLFSN